MNDFDKNLQELKETIEKMSNDIADISNNISRMNRHLDNIDSGIRSFHRTNEAFRRYSLPPLVSDLGPDGKPISPFAQ